MKHDMMSDNAQTDALYFALISFSKCGHKTSILGEVIY